MSAPWIIKAVDVFEDSQLCLTTCVPRISLTALDELNYFALNTVIVIAESVEVQPSTLVRFAKEFGYGGFSQLQRVFRLRLIEGAPDKRAQVYAEKQTAVRRKDGLDETLVEPNRAALRLKQFRA